MSFWGVPAGSHRSGAVAAEDAVDAGCSPRRSTGRAPYRMSREPLVLWVPSRATVVLPRARPDPSTPVHPRRPHPAAAGVAPPQPGATTSQHQSVQLPPTVYSWRHLGLLLEQTIKDAKQILGVGDAQNRLETADDAPCRS